MNIILVTSATAKARTLTLDWRHGAAAAIALLLLMLASGLLTHLAIARWGAPLPPAVADLAGATEQRRDDELRGHLSAMAMRLGELQAQLLKLDGLGERLAKVAGLKPQELPTLSPGTSPGRGGALSSLPSRDLTLPEFETVLASLGQEIEQRSDQLGLLEALLVQGSASRRFMPSLLPVHEVWYSSNYGYRIDPFTGQNAFHEGVDFLAEPGTPIVAAASGRVAFAGWHPQYGKMVDIDHGNGLVSRYAHASKLLVSEGDRVVRGQTIAAVGSTGRSTGAHLHFEVRLNGVPQNPARFLQASN